MRDGEEDAGLTAHDRLDAIGCNEQSCVEGLLTSTVLVVHDLPVVRDVAAGDTRGGDELHVRMTLECPPQRGTDRAVRHDVAQGLEPLLRRIDASAAEPAAIRHVDAPDRSRLARHRFPRAQRPEGPDAAVGERGGALVEARVLVAAVRRDRLEQRDA